MINCVCGFRLLIFFLQWHLKLKSRVEETKKIFPNNFVHLEGFSLISLRAVEIQYSTLQ
jgi:hypothetical protein